MTIGYYKYISKNHSDATIADWMNQQPVIQKLREGRQPYGKETVRDILKNRLYTGRVSYAETLYSGALGEGKKATRNRKKWFEGKHEAIISDEVYDLCQKVRADATKVFSRPATVRTYVLHDRTFCARCIARKEEGIADERIGKMRPAWNKKRNYGIYRCVAHDRGYQKCDQPSIRIENLDDQVFDIIWICCVSSHAEPSASCRRRRMQP